jgi:dihydroxyacetone kinase-like protein
MRRQFVNDPQDHVREALAGFARANAQLVRLNPDPAYIARAQPAAAKVGLLAGGGSGHEPMHTGFVGTGMLDVAVPGAVFSSPTAEQVEAGTRAADTGTGVLHVVKNYTGDKLNFSIAAEIVGDDGIEVRRVLVADDLATDSADPDGIGRPSFELADDEVEFGVGIHGERGIDRRPFAPADTLAAALAEPVIDALSLSSGERVLVIVNGLGSTHPLELAVVYGAVARMLDGRGIATERSLVGPYVTALDMAGCSVTMTRLDDELVDLWDAPVRTPGLTW